MYSLIAVRPGPLPIKWRLFLCFLPKLSNFLFNIPNAPIMVAYLHLLRLLTQYSSVITGVYRVTSLLSPFMVNKRTEDFTLSFDHYCSVYCPSIFFFLYLLVVLVLTCLNDRNFIIQLNTVECQSLVFQ